MLARVSSGYLYDRGFTSYGEFPWHASIRFCSLFVFYLVCMYEIFVVVAMCAWGGDGLWHFVWGLEPGILWHCAFRYSSILALMKVRHMQGVWFIANRQD